MRVCVCWHEGSVCVDMRSGVCGCWHGESSVRVLTWGLVCVDMKSSGCVFACRHEEWCVCACVCVCVCACANIRAVCVRVSEWLRVCVCLFLRVCVCVCMEVCVTCVCEAIFQSGRLSVVTGKQQSNYQISCTKTAVRMFCDLSASNLHSEVWLHNYKLLT